MRGINNLMMFVIVVTLVLAILAAIKINITNKNIIKLQEVQNTVYNNNETVNQTIKRLLK